MCLSGIRSNSDSSESNKYDISDAILIQKPELFELLRKTTNVKNQLLLDSVYCATNIKVAKEFLSSTDVDTLKYRPESFDCEDFSMVLCGKFKELSGQLELKGGCAFGIITGKLPVRTNGVVSEVNHAMNIFVDNKSAIYIIEPQSDDIKSWEEFKRFAQDNNVKLDIYNIIM